jgi:protein-S-isoprenylcysteine O-methyltransferase Ste14
MTNSNSPWWRGTRGEWYVVVQVLLFVLVACGPRTLPGWPAWSFPSPVAGRVVSLILLGIGALFIGAGARHLGRHLTPLPHPRAGAPLRDSGAYGLVRHPIYSGGIFVAFGWSIWARGWLTLVYAAILFVFLDLKARREERWLRRMYPEYAAYTRRVRRLVPFVY